MEGSESLFVLYKEYRNGGNIQLMKGLDRAKSDYNDLLAISNCFARLGRKVKVLSPVHYKDTLYSGIYGKLIGTRYYRKCPDLCIDGEYYEYESYQRPFKSSKVSHMLKHGAEQAKRIIIDNNKGASDRFILNMIVKRINDKHFRYCIEEVFLYEKGNIRQLYPIKKSGKKPRLLPQHESVESLLQI